MSNKLKNDKYYTEPNVVTTCLDFLKNTLSNHNIKISDIIEPSAGNGAFSRRVKCTAYDIEPEHPSIIRQDFLTLDILYKKGRVVLGNPPFGSGNTLSVKFFKKAVQIADIIAFIQPISQLNNNLQMYEFDLIGSLDLGIQRYTDRDLHCCFNIYLRPNSGALNKKPNYKLKDVELIEYRRGNSSYGNKGRIKEGFDYSFCNWGNGSMGKQPTFIGEYAQEVYVYVKNKKYLQKVLNLLEYNTIRNYVISTSMKRISVMKLYMYLKSNIEGIE